MNKYIEQLKSGEYQAFLHDWYCGFSYGVAVNPIILNYSEYEILKDYLTKKGEGQIFFDFENSDDFNLKLNENIIKIINKRLLTPAPKNCVHYDSKEVELDCQKEKEILMKKISECEN